MLASTYLTSVPSVISSTTTFTGTVTFSSSSYVNISQSLTLPSNQVLNSSTTLVDLNSAQTITATKTFSNGLIISGGTLTINSGASETDNGALVVNGLLTANAGIQLPTTAYTPSTNYLGYQPTITFINPVYLTTSVSTNCSSVSLSAGTWLLQGQVDFYSYNSISATIVNMSASISSSVGVSNFRIANSLNTAGNFIMQVMGVVSVSATTTYYLVGFCNFTTGSMMIRTTASTTSSTTTSATSSSTSVVITATNSAIIVGMTITGTGIVGTCIVFSISGTTITLTSAQSIGASTVLTFTMASNTNFTATRIA
jgi:hypothetical protein